VPLAAGGPVIPNFGGGSCPNTGCCWSWVQNNWGSLLAPSLIQHIYITLIALAVGLAISLTAALLAFRMNWFEKTFGAFSTILYTIPTLAFVDLFVPFTGIGLLTMELALTGYTFLLLFRNILTGLRSAPPEAVAAATGMGMTRNQIMLKINLPLALPSIMAGLRIASVTAIALAAIASLLVPLGLGSPIRAALQTSFQTELIAASILTILLALVGDVIFVLIRRAITPWTRTRGGGKG
jgi:osmoprotectant transport system permease protein